MFEEVRDRLADELDLDRKSVERGTDLRKEYDLSSLEYLGALLSLESLLDEDEVLNTEPLLPLRTVGEIADYMERIV